MERLRGRRLFCLSGNSLRLGGWMRGLGCIGSLVTIILIVIVIFGTHKTIITTTP